MSEQRDSEARGDDPLTCSKSPEDTSRVEEDEPIDLTTPVRTRARLAAWREVEGDIAGYDSEGYQRMIDHWPVVDDPERLGEVDEGESRAERVAAYREALQEIAKRLRREAREPAPEERGE